MPPVPVTSEIGALRAVLTHTPGRELVAVTPGNREDYLYDDIIDLDIAVREHRRCLREQAEARAREAREAQAQAARQRDLAQERL